MAIQDGNVESMMYAGATPWHNFGTACKEAPSARDALRLAGLDWTVKPTELHYGAGNRLADGFVANVRSDTGNMLGIVSNKYKIVQNEEGFAFVDALLDMGAKIETAGSLDDGKKVWILAQLEPYQLLDDEINKYMFFANSFDGKGALKCGRTDVRIVCENTFNLALKSASRSWSIKHMGVDMQSKMLEATEALKLNNQYQLALQAEAEILAIKHISDNEFQKFLDQMFPYDNEASHCVKERTYRNRGYLELAYNQNDLGNLKGTAWGLLQATADMAFHKEPDRKTDTYVDSLMDYAMDGHPLIDKAYSLISA